MLCAAIKDCPVFGGKLISFDAAKVQNMPGVKHVVKVGDSAVAVVAERWWQAKTALDALPVTWDEGENTKVSSATIAESLKGGLDAEQAFVGNEHGDVKQAIANAAKKVEAVYAYPYQNHATMEPMNTTALYTADRCEAWVPTQVAEAALAAVSEASGLPIAKCDVRKLPLGGGFGRRTAHDFVHQAVAIAKQIPGLKKYNISTGVVRTPAGPSGVHLVAELNFDSFEALAAGMASPQGQAAAADVPNFATGGVDLYLFDLKEA